VVHIHYPVEVHKMTNYSNSDMVFILAVFLGIGMIIGMLLIQTALPDQVKYNQEISKLKTTNQNLGWDLTVCNARVVAYKYCITDEELYLIWLGLGLVTTTVTATTLIGEND
jgi:uncharacterized membrane protein YciS (DUF1049 family)